MTHTTYAAALAADPTAIWLDVSPDVTFGGATSPTQYIVQTASAQMPSSCWGVYRRVAVIEVEAGVRNVSMISERAKGAIRIVEHWEDLNVGTTARCAYGKALREAAALADRLNAEARTRAARAAAVEAVLHAAGSDDLEAVAAEIDSLVAAVIRRRGATEAGVGAYYSDAAERIAAVVEEISR